MIYRDGDFLPDEGELIKMTEGSLRKALLSESIAFITPKSDDWVEPIVDGVWG